ncbi:hypothetical protein GYMLUDRAFT_85491 [Collybiopsis luxurians FD-317 M1]|uniref:Uncharacterized protein n=1 Tax=Collybiopsis luxurians FD-317 M1 TaxID=944289 RepID=A0A0D0CVR5_9AGAR|nr:hypothetical protein GYMLUDRAFT_85491 [Collybiopsis luxurians FD-317 M1]
MWPPEIRSDFRHAVRAKCNGDLEFSERRLHRAWNTIQSLSLKTQNNRAGSGFWRHFGALQGSAGGGSEDVDYHSQEPINLPLLPLPSWMNKTDIGAPLGALGAFYAQAGRLEPPWFAMPLYLNAISLLVPPAPKKSSVDDRRRDAQLMTNLSELIMRGTPTLQAEAWAS